MNKLIIGSKRKVNIAILTILSINYGNRLQNYALQKILEKLGNNVVTLNRNKITFKAKIKKKIRKYIKNDKITYFNNFDRNIKWSKYTVSKEYVSKNIDKKFDMFVIGSDQIWNVNFDFISNIDFLTMIPKDKKISYAASFGISNISKDKQKTVGAWLNNIKKISVREYSGVDIVDQISNQKAIRVLDPTLMLYKEEWKKLEIKPNINLPKQYMIKYFLGDKEYESYIKKIAEKNNIIIIDVLDYEKYIGPAEFIYLFDHAEMIVTDSFHGSVFSFLFEKPFIIFERKGVKEDMTSRIDTFCQLFKLNYVRYSSKEFCLDKIYKADYTISKKILSEEREKSIKYLVDALNI